MSLEKLTLDKLKVGDKCKVKSIYFDSKVRRRLMDMGIVKGTNIEVEGKAPMGDPIEIRLRGYNLTLRKSEAKDIIVEHV